MRIFFSLKKKTWGSIIFTSYYQVHIKGACSASDPQPHLPTSFKQILVPEVESYFEGFMCEVA